MAVQVREYLRYLRTASVLDGFAHPLCRLFLSGYCCHHLVKPYCRQDNHQLIIISLLVPLSRATPAIPRQAPCRAG